MAKRKPSKTRNQARRSSHPSAIQRRQCRDQLVQIGLSTTGGNQNLGHPALGFLESGDRARHVTPQARGGN